MSALESSPTPIFIPLVGQYGNIGDIILRRPLAKWLQGKGQLHVFVGAEAPADYVNSLELSHNAKIYYSFKDWHRTALTESKRQKSVYLSKPGEIQLTASGMKEHLGLLPMMWRLRKNGGRIARLGAGTRNYSTFYRTMMRPAINLSNMIYWRDRGTYDHMKSGGLMPDLGFYEGSSNEQIASSDGRDLLLVSMRADKPLPSPAWLDAVRKVAVNHDLSIWVVTQVALDAERSQTLAKLLNAELLNWDGNNHSQQEQRLRQLYRRSLLTVSDRLHVLIAAFTEGAIPAGLLTAPTDKIGRHFEVLGLREVERFRPKWTSNELAAYLEDALKQREFYFDALSQARFKLESIKSKLSHFIGGL